MAETSVPTAPEGLPEFCVSVASVTVIALFSTGESSAPLIVITSCAVSVRLPGSLTV